MSTEAKVNGRRITAADLQRQVEERRRDQPPRHSEPATRPDGADGSMSDDVRVEVAKTCTRCERGFTALGVRMHGSVMCLQRMCDPCIEAEKREAEEAERREEEERE